MLGLSVIFGKKNKHEGCNSFLKMWQKSTNSPSLDGSSKDRRNVLNKNETKIDGKKLALFGAGSGSTGKRQ